jgi:hypothetical protein
LAWIVFSLVRNATLAVVQLLTDKVSYLAWIVVQVGPQPAELGGQRALDFVLDNNTLQDLNRTLLFDIKLLAVRLAK